VVDSIQREAHDHEVFYQYIGIYTRNMSHILHTLWMTLCQWALDLMIMLFIAVISVCKRSHSKASQRPMLSPHSAKATTGWMSRKYSCPGFRVLLPLSICAIVALNFSLPHIDNHIKEQSHKGTRGAAGAASATAT
jgi:hypothetical protein